MKVIKNVLRIGGLSLGTAAFLQGCSRLVLFDPKGPIGASERYVIIAAFALMLIVVIPVAVMTLWFPWKYRASNPKATYAPNWSRSGWIEAIVWIVPAIIVTLLGVLVWTHTYRLDPYKPIPAGVAPLHIQAVSLDWKWLFIYPDQDMAVVDQMVFPANVPLDFRITSDTVMASFFIPQLGSQIYAMAGMQTRLHLMADTPGVYAGQNQQFSGRGYADMNFKANATSREAFDAWVRKVKKSPHRLDLARYADMQKPGIGYHPDFFSAVKPGLFEYILHKYDKVAGLTGSPSVSEPGALPEKTDPPEER
jgi:cytochrome o ubiquinol oxidase subunit II